MAVAFGWRSAAFMRYLISASDDKIFPEGGGMLIRAGNGEVIGAVGVTGDTHGIHAAGLKTDDVCADMGREVKVRRTK